MRPPPADAPRHGEALFEMISLSSSPRLARMAMRAPILPARPLYEDRRAMPLTFPTPPLSGRTLTSAPPTFDAPMLPGGRS